MLYRKGPSVKTWLRVNALPIKDETGQPQVVVCTFHEVTKEKELEQKLKKTNQELERINAELNRFAGVAAHDLKAPLNTITSYLELLSHELEKSALESSSPYLKTINSASQRGRKLIDQLLNFARIGGATFSDFQQVNLNMVLDIAVENLKASIEASGASIEKDELPFIFGIESELTQLFQNLISNSLKFRSNEFPHIAIRLVPDAHEVVLDYKDNGMGIEPEDIPFVFEPFKRTLSSSNIAGSGLGLSICSKIMANHKGKISIQSEPGRGTCFRLSFPKTPKSA
jgi:signal transduction histidine kinase